MHGQTRFFDFLSQESLPRESVDGKTLSHFASEFKTLRKITLVLAPCLPSTPASTFSHSNISFSLLSWLLPSLSCPAPGKSAHAFRLRIHAQELDPHSAPQAALPLLALVSPEEPVAP
jgi:hypothetical protein